MRRWITIPLPYGRVALDVSSNAKPFLLIPYDTVVKPRLPGNIIASVLACPAGNSPFVLIHDDGQRTGIGSESGHGRVFRWYGSV